MKKIIFLFTILPFLFHCSTRQGEVERIMEDGVEVVVNHQEPYKIKGEPSILHLEEEFTIDTERNEIAEIGVIDIGSYDVDSKGNIYIFQGRENDLNVVYKFNEIGNFVKAIGKKGQGPGEIQIPMFLSITDEDQIPIQDRNTKKLYIFDRDGVLIKETRILSEDVLGSFGFFPLENGNYLKFGEYFDPESQHRQNILEMTDPHFRTIRELDRCDHGKVVAFAQQKKVFTPRVFIHQVSDGLVYVGHEKRGYEILIYDLDGNLLKKIRKKYKPADVPEIYKERWLANIGRYKNRLIFPDKMPPFHYFFLDDEGRLYVKTYEKGDKQNEYMHDIFNSEGIFIARASMAGYGRWIYPDVSLDRAKSKNSRFYCIREKKSGYKELAVYRMKWQDFF